LLNHFYVAHATTTSLPHPSPIQPFFLFIPLLQDPSEPFVVILLAPATQNTLSPI
jgi:hypothetical protein